MRLPGLYIIGAIIVMILAGMRPGDGRAIGKKTVPFQEEIDVYTAVTYSLDSLLDAQVKLEAQVKRKKRELENVDDEIELADSTLDQSIQIDHRDSVLNNLDSTKTMLSKSQSILDSLEVEIEEMKDLLERLSPGIIKLSADIDEGITVKYRGTDYLIFKADLNEHEINFHLLDPEDCSGLHSLKNSMSTYGEDEKEVLMATNAGMYTETRLPKGLYIENYEELEPLDTRSPDVMANFYLMPNGVFFMDEAGKPFVTTTPSFVDDVMDLPKPPIIRNATQSGPMLVIDGELHDAFMYRSKNLHIRNGVGVKDEQTVYFAMSLQRTNFYDLATVFKYFLGCKNALYLDGAISRMYVRGHAEKDKGGRFGPMISVVRKHAE